MFEIPQVAIVVAILVGILRTLVMRRVGLRLPGVAWVIFAALLAAALGAANDAAGPGLSQATVAHCAAIMVTASGGWSVLKATFEHALGLNAAPAPMPDPTNLPPAPDPSQVATQALDTLASVLADARQQIAAGAQSSVSAQQAP